MLLYFTYDSATYESANEVTKKYNLKEVYILAKYLGLPECIINKKPSAGLWEGQTDEEGLGIKYEENVLIKNINTKYL